MLTIYRHTVMFLVKTIRAVHRFWEYLKSKVHGLIDLILDRIVIFLCRHYQGPHYEGY